MTKLVKQKYTLSLNSTLTSIRLNGLCSPQKTKITSSGVVLRSIACAETSIKVLIMEVIIAKDGEEAAAVVRRLDPNLNKTKVL